VGEIAAEVRSARDLLFATRGYDLENLVEHI
jgi:hypothetical protein